MDPTKVMETFGAVMTMTFATVPLSTAIMSMSPLALSLIFSVALVLEQHKNTLPLVHLTHAQLQAIVIVVEVVEVAEAVLTLVQLMQKRKQLFILWVFQPQQLPS